MAGVTRNPYGAAKQQVALNTTVPLECKKLIERTAKALNVSQAVAIAEILGRVETNIEGLPMWLNDEEGRLPLEKTA